MVISSNKSFIVIMLFFLASCGKRYHIKEHLYFTYYENTDYTNIYFYDLPVIPGGCDSAMWNDSIIIAKGYFSRYLGLNSYENTNFDSINYYFFINIEEYQADPRQEMSSGFKGPLSPTQIEEQSLVFEENGFIGF